MRVETAAVALCALVLCGCGGGSGGSSAPSTTAPASSAAVTTSSAPTIDGAALEAAMEARRQAYVGYSALGTGRYSQLAKLMTGAPVDRQTFVDLYDFIDARYDTADFRVCTLLRLLYLRGNDPGFPTDLRNRARTTLLGFRYWIDELWAKDNMVFWSENHQILFASSEYLAGQLYPQEVFGTSGFTGADRMQRARPRILRWLDHRLRFGYSEFYSPVYYPHDVAPLLNLIDFAQDPEIQTKARMALDLLVFDLARITFAGVVGAPSGRSYVEQKLGGREQGVGDLVEILWGTRGDFVDKGSTAGTAFATSSYRVPHALLAIGLDKARPRFTDRSRVGVSFAEAPAEGIGFTSLEDGMFWWGQGGYMAPEVIALSRDMIEAWNLYENAIFQYMKPLRFLPRSALSAFSDRLSVLSRGSFLGGARTTCFRTPEAQLASAFDFLPGQVGFQAHAWQATLGMDAVVFTTAPGLVGRQGPGTWTGSGSLPKVAQHENVAIVLYNPGALQRTLWPPYSHAYFPRAAFDELEERSGWTCARKGDGYLALYSAEPTQWTSSGPEAGRELVAYAPRNAWVCVVGSAAEHGSFAQFVDAVSQARLDTQGSGQGGPSDPLFVEFEAPGVGTLRLDWTQDPTLDGTALPTVYPRFENPYSHTAWGDPQVAIEHGGLRLDLDVAAGTRQGDGL
ncbi:MAG: hypothetical protein R3F62_07295 [Planctomycetota bacterium]